MPTFLHWQFIDQNLATAISSTISPSILPYVLNLDTIADIWHSLSRRCQSTNRSRFMQLKNELHHLSMKDKSMETYLSEIKHIIDLLASAVELVSNEDIILYTLNGLPPTYQGFKIALRTRLDPIHLEDFYSLLCSEEINIHREQSTTNTTQLMGMPAVKTRGSNTTAPAVVHKTTAPIVADHLNLIHEMIAPLLNAKFAKSLGTLLAHVGIASIPTTHPHRHPILLLLLKLTLPTPITSPPKIGSWTAVQQPTSLPRFNTSNNLNPTTVRIT